MRTAARICLSEIDRPGARSDVVLQEALSRADLAARDRHLLHEIVLGVLRRRGSLDGIMEHLSGVSLKSLSPAILQILRIGTYQILFLDRVPGHAAVNEAAEDAKHVGGPKSAGFVNAVLRKCVGNREAILSWRPDGTNVEQLAFETSHPVWLVRRWRARWGKEISRKMLLADNEIPPLTLRVNKLKTDRGRLMQLFAADGIGAVPTAVSSDGVVVHKSGSPTRFPGFAEGLFYIQDEAAQLIGRMVGARPGERILDTCAAPGGKTFHLAEEMEGRGEIVALDSDAVRLKLLRDNADRLGIRIVQGDQMDASRGLHFRDRRGFDRVLVDAPCTAMGVLRRHPEARWLKDERSITEASSLQFKILSSAAPWVKPGGELVYSTCATEPEENEEVVLRFLERFGDFELRDSGEHLPDKARLFVAPDGFFRTYPNDAGMDGFFGARMIKRRRA